MWLRLTILRKIVAAKAIVATVVMFAALPSHASGLQLWLLSAASKRYLASKLVTEPLRFQSKTSSFSFCTLVSKPSLYQEKIVRTRAILVAGYEQYFLYSPECSSQDKLVWAEHDPRGESNPSINKQLESLLRVRSPNEQAGRAQVSLIGRLIAPGLKRFGHLDQFRMKFVITSVEDAKPVSPKTAWPSIDSSDTSADRMVREINKEFILHVAGAPSYAVIPSELLANKFRFIDIDRKVKSRSDFLATTFTPYSGLIHDKEIEVRLRGDSAVVTGLIVKSADDSGDKRYGYSVQYVRSDGKWQIVTAQLRKQ